MHNLIQTMQLIWHLDWYSNVSVWPIHEEKHATKSTKERAK
ncbi:hypothetical protein [Pseudoalteromonas phenolica]|nr:hypothetical protein [Pseudoalteromonas phenolica]